MRFIFGMQRNFKIFYKLILPFWVCVSRHVYSTQNKKFAYLCKYLQKNMGLKWFFCLQKVFYKMIVIWMCVTRLAQSTQNNKLAIYLQYLKENKKNEGDFLLTDKHQRFLQNDTIILGVCVQA